MLQEGKGGQFVMQNSTFMQEYDLIPFDYLWSQSISQHCAYRRYINPVIFFRFIFETRFAALLNSKTCNKCHILIFLS